MNRTRQTGTKRILVTCALLSLCAAAYAQSTASSAPEIGVQPLNQALSTFAKQTGLQLIYVSDDAAGRQSKPIPGGLSPPEALEKLLKGTGLSFEFVNERTVRIFTATAVRPASISLVGDEAEAVDRVRIARAEDATQTERTDSSSHEGAALEEIIVTAQKRSEAASKVPISMTVYDQVAMDRQGVRSFEDIASITPGISWSDNSFNDNVSIRGVSSLSGLPTAGIYLDDMPVGERQALLTTGAPSIKIFDLERVEVLRGPQGTLFGAGAQAGVIRFITPQPSLTEYTGYSRADISATKGGDLGYEAGMAVGGPIVQDKVGFRVSASYRRGAGWVDHRSSIPGGHHQTDSNWERSSVVRGALTFAPNDVLTVTPSVYYQKFHLDDRSNFDPLIAEPDRGQFVNPHLIRTPEDDELYLPSLKIGWDIGNVSLTSLTSFLDRTRSSMLDYTTIWPGVFGAPAPSSTDQVSPVFFHGETHTFAQELRLQSADPTAKFQWSIGGYFSNTDQRRSQDIIYLSFPQLVQDVFGAPVETVFGSGLTEGGSIFDAHLRLNDRQLAGFSQLSYRFFGDVSLVAGVRVARQHHDFRYDATGALNGLGVHTSGAHDETVVTPKFGVNYQLNDDNLLYLSVAKGTRMGGANQPLALTAAPACQAQLQELGVVGSPEAFKTDSLWNYEIGSKNRLFNNRLQVEASVFHLGWSDIQQAVSVPACASSFVGNIAKAKSDGFDLALNALVATKLKLGLAVGYSNAKLTEGVDAGSVVYALEGDQISDIPPWIVSASVEYGFRLFREHEAYVRLDNTYRSKNSGPFSNQHPQTLSFNPYFRADDSSNELNLRSGVDWKGMELSAYVRNVLNATPLSDLDLNPVFDAVGKARTLTPRTVGITAVYRW